MERITTREKKFKEWCEENGGEFSFLGNRAECKHPNGDTLKFEDPAFDQQFGDLVVPFSRQESVDSDPIMYKGGSGSFTDVDRNQFNDKGDSPLDNNQKLAFIDRRDYEYALIGFGDNGFVKINDGSY